MDRAKSAFLIWRFRSRRAVTRGRPCTGSRGQANSAMVYQGGEDTGGRRVYVGNIAYDCTESEIRIAFAEVAAPALATPRLTGSGRSRAPPRVSARLPPCAATPPPAKPAPRLPRAVRYYHSHLIQARLRLRGL